MFVQVSRPFSPSYVRALSWSWGHDFASHLFLFYYSLKLSKFIEINLFTIFSWKDAPQSLTSIHLYDNQITEFLWKDCPDKVHIDGLSDKQSYELREYRSAKKIQRVYLRHYTRRKCAATKVAKGCHNWLYKPRCNDGTIGIVPRLHLKYL